MNTLKITVLMFAGLIIMNSCSNEPLIQKTPVNDVTVIFIDKSGSVNINEGVLKKLKSKLDEVVSKNMKTTGDKLSTYFIHQNTSSKDLYKSFEISSALPFDFFQKNTNDQERTVRQFESKLKIEQELIFRSLCEALELLPNRENRTTTGSDILGTLKVAHDFFNESDSIANKHIVYISDMIECMPKTHNFYKSLPESNQAAIEMANHDFERITQMWPELKNSAQFKGTDVQVFIPRNILDDNQTVSVLEYYYKKIFEKVSATYKQN